MGAAEKAVEYAIQIANDDSHGYSQYNRWGNPDYDCSALVIDCYQKAGIDVKSAGASYTGNMLNAFLSKGFRKVNPAIESLLPGDVLLNVVNHAAIYIGNNQIVQATIAENGTIHGQPGDQTGKEIGIYKYYDYPWDYVLRLDSDSPAPSIPDENISYTDADCVATQMPIIQRGEYGPAVAAMQGGLKYHGFFKQADISGVFDIKTETALLDFQRRHKIDADGICGPITWNEIMFWR